MKGERLEPKWIRDIYIHIYIYIYIYNYHHNWLSYGFRVGGSGWALRVSVLMVSSGVGWGGVGWGGVGWGGVGWDGVGWGGYTEFILFYKAHYYIYTEYCSLADYCVTFCLCLD